MRVVLQRVAEASVKIDGTIRGAIETGLLILVGIEAADTNEDIDWLVHKIVNLRIFPDDEGVMNRNIQAIGGEILVISQFTLHAKTKKGNRPSYIHAARPEQAIPLYEAFKTQLTDALGRSVESGEFGADMKVSLINDGPVTITIDTKRKE